MEQPAYFQVAFRPNITLISTVRRFVSEFYLRILTDHELASRLTLATHELLENAVNYAADGETSIRIEVLDEALVITTSNRATAEQRAAVEKLVADLNNAADVDDYFQQLLVETAKRPLGSGLGLARIRAEADMDIALTIEGDNVHVSATAHKLEEGHKQ